MARYDENIIQEFAAKLYDQAQLIVFMYTVGAALIGGLGGYFVADGGGAVVGALVLGAIGYGVGSSRAFVLKLTAQTALCQVQIERNTRALVGGASDSIHVQKQMEITDGDDTFNAETAELAADVDVNEAVERSLGYAPNDVQLADWVRSKRPPKRKLDRLATELGIPEMEVHRMNYNDLLDAVAIYLEKYQRGA